MRRFRVCCFIASTFLAVARASATSIVLDQQNDGSVGFNGTNLLVWQQEVVAGKTGKLMSIDLLAYFATNPLRPSDNTAIVSVNLGAPFQIDLAEFTATHTFTGVLHSDPADPRYGEYFGWNSIDVSSANIFLTVGQHFVIGFKGSDFSQWPGLLGSAFGQPGYVAGELCFSDVSQNGKVFCGASNIFGANDDFAFRTFIDTDATPTASQVPEPASLLLVGTGVVAAVKLRRRAP